MIINDYDVLKQLSENLEVITGMSFTLCDEFKNLIFPIPGHPKKICSAISSVQKLEQRCIENNCFGLDEAEKTRNLVVYKCHMGFYEAVSPIIVYDQIIGYIMLGQVGEKGNEKEIKAHIQYVNEKYNLGVNSIDLSGVSFIDKDVIYASAKIIEIVSSYLWLNSVISLKSAGRFDLFQNYVLRNISKKISVDDLCTELYISKTSLYNLVVENTGMSIMRYIYCEKIKKAKELLVKTDMSLQSIAEGIGIDDVNYFIRFFKREVGVTPHKYRVENI